MTADMQIMKSETKHIILILPKSTDKGSVKQDVIHKIDHILNRREVNLTD